MTDKVWGEVPPVFEGGLFAIDAKDEKGFYALIPRITVDARRQLFVEPKDVFKVFPEPDADFNISTAEKQNQRAASLVL